MSSSLLLVALLAACSLADPSEISINGKVIKDKGADHFRPGFELPASGLPSCTHLPFRTLALGSPDPVVSIKNTGSDHTIFLDRAHIATVDMPSIDVFFVEYDSSTDAIPPGKEKQLRIGFVCHSDLRFWSEASMTFDIRDPQGEHPSRLYEASFIVQCAGADRYPLDISPWVLFAIAVLIVGVVTRQPVVSREEGALEVKPWAAVVWIVMASLALVLLFFFLEYLQLLLRILISFVAALALAFLIEGACCERLVHATG